MQSEERKRGDRWAEKRRAEGCWVQKLPGGSISGLPDWLVVEPGYGIRLVEAKVRQLQGSACTRAMFSTAQRLWLECIARYGGDARMLVLGEDDYAEVRLANEFGGGVRHVSQSEYRRLAESYA